MIFLQSVTGWHWFVLGFALLFVQLAGFGRIFVGMAAGAILVAMVMSIVPIAMPLQLALFAVFSLAGTAVYWRYFRLKPAENATEKLGKRKAKLIGTRASLLARTKDGRGRVQIHDALWPVVCGQDLPAGTIVEVTGFDDQGLHVSNVRQGRAASVGG